MSQKKELWFDAVRPFESFLINVPFPWLENAVKMGISISASARDDNPTLLHFNYIVFLHAARISISIFSSPSLSLRQLYSPCQRPHVINLCHPRVMFILFKRAPWEEPIKKKEREIDLLLAESRAEGLSPNSSTASVSFACLSLCNRSARRWYTRPAGLRQYISMQLKLPSPAWEVANPSKSAAALDEKRSCCRIQWPKLTPFK